MLCISLTEPWASLVACGAKQIETRSWTTDYRGKIAIHASKKMTGADLEFALSSPLVRRSLGLTAPTPGIRPIVKDAFADTRGRVIAVATLTRCLPIFDAYRTRRLWSVGQGEITLTDDELRFGNYVNGRYAWILADVHKLATPIPATGSLGLWTWEPPAGALPADQDRLVTRTGERTAGRGR